MSDDAPQPTSGSLTALIIRACPVHETCSLKCPRRPVEDLGEIAGFDHSSSVPPSIIQRLREGLHSWHR
jgi:hypothetical protein